MRSHSGSAKVKITEMKKK